MVNLETKIFNTEDTGEHRVGQNETGVVNEDFTSAF